MCWVQFSTPREPWRKGSSSASRKDKVRLLEGLPGKIAGQAGGLSRPLLDSTREDAASWRC